MLEDMTQVDILGSWLRNEQMMIDQYCLKLQKVTLLALEPYWAIKPWTRALVGKKVLVIHGPNLNLLGEREPGVYGSTTFADLNRMILDRAEGLGLECEIFQSNHEGAIIDKLHAARKTFDGVVINAGAYTHYSYAIHDAIHDIRIPCVEVHISNIYARDQFRSHSVLSPVCAGTIAGFGINGYFLALQALSEM